ncbi:MAG: hypothetical protein BYD32DRAFT_441197, partial [Podila humilis]
EEEAEDDEDGELGVDGEEDVEPEANDEADEFEEGGENFGVVNPNDWIEESGEEQPVEEKDLLVIVEFIWWYDTANHGQTRPAGNRHDDEAKEAPGTPKGVGGRDYKNLSQRQDLKYLEEFEMGASTSASTGGVKDLVHFHCGGSPTEKPHTKEILEI